MIALYPLGAWTPVPSKNLRQKLFGEQAERDLAATSSRQVPMTVPVDTKQRSVAIDKFEQTPLYFEQNQGQADPSVKYLAKSSGMTLFLSETENVMVLNRAGAAAGKRSPSDATLESKGLTPSVIRMKLLGRNSRASVQGVDRLPGASNYLIGSDPHKWVLGAAHYRKARVANVYDGIDVVYYGNQRNFEYDFVVKPGGDPSRIDLVFEGAKARLNTNGDLILATSAGEITQHKPRVYQEIDGRNVEIDARYRVRGSVVQFEVAEYDRSRKLIIDPLIAWSTYLGGGSSDTGYSLAVDSAGAVYVARQTLSTNFPTTSAYQSSLSSPYDAFVTKINADGSGLAWSTFLGGSGSDSVSSIVVDPSGAIYVAGSTLSTNFPAQSSYQSSNAGQEDAFVTKISSAGNTLVWSTYLGGAASDVARAMTIDANGNVYVAGSTYSTNFPMSNALQSGLAGYQDGFVTKINQDGGSLSWSTYLGGTSSEAVNAVAVDSVGAVYVAGGTLSSDFPVQNALQSSLHGGQDGFVAKISGDGRGLLWSTYLGGSFNDGVNAVTVDGNGAVYVAGATYSSDFPVVHGYQPTLAGPADAFVSVLTPDGGSLTWSTYLGGTGSDGAYAVAIDASGVYVAGGTSSTNFPVLNSAQLGVPNSTDAFVTKINLQGNGLAWSSRLGGSNTDTAASIVVDSVGEVYVTGTTYSTDFPVGSALQPALSGANSFYSDAFVTKINPLLATATSITSVSSSPAFANTPYSVSYSVGSTYHAAISGTVTITDGNGGSCTGPAPSGLCWLTSTVVGANTLTASYSGDAVNNPSSASVAQTIVLNSGVIPTVTSATVSSVSATVGQAYAISYTVTSTAGTPTGNVTVSDGTVLNTCAVIAGVCAIASSSVGNKAITVVYLGDANFIPSSATLAINITPPSAQTSFIGSLAQIVSGGTWKMTLNFLNLGVTSQDATWDFTDDNGNPLIFPFTFPQSPQTPQLSTPSVTRTLAPNAQFVVQSNGLNTQPTNQGWARLSGGAGITGFGIFGNTSLGSEAVVPLETRDASRYILAFDNTGTLVTGLAIANLSGISATIPVIIRDSGGTSIQSTSITLGAYAHTSFMLNTFNSSTSGKSGTVEVQTPSDSRISVLGLRSNGSSLTTLPVLANVSSVGGSFAHILYNGAFTNGFVLVNTSSASANAVLNFFAESGQPLAVPVQVPQSSQTITTTSSFVQTIPANGSVYIQTVGDSTQPVVAGSARLVATGAISGFGIFKWLQSGQEASVPLENREASSYVLPFDNTNGLATGIAVAEITGVRTTVPILIRDDSGNQLLATALTLAGNGHTSFMITDAYSVTVGIRGTIEFAAPSGGQISAIGLRATPSGNLTTIPVLAK